MVAEESSTTQLDKEYLNVKLDIILSRDKIFLLSRLAVLPNQSIVNCVFSQGSLLMSSLLVVITNIESTIDSGSH